MIEVVAEIVRVKLVHRLAEIQDVFLTRFNSLFLHFLAFALALLPRGSARLNLLLNCIEQIGFRGPLLLKSWHDHQAARYWRNSATLTRYCELSVIIDGLIPNWSLIFTIGAVTSIMISLLFVMV